LEASGYSISLLFTVAALKVESRCNYFPSSPASTSASASASNAPTSSKYPATAKAIGSL
jgi:hypothetical protein